MCKIKVFSQIMITLGCFLRLQGSKVSSRLGYVGLFDMIACCV